MLGNQWPAHLMRDVQLRKIAEVDPALLARLLALADRLAGDAPRVSPAVSSAYASYVHEAFTHMTSEPTDAENVYAAARIRSRLSHKRAVSAARLGRLDATSADLRNSIRKAIRRELDAIAKEAGITKEDVLQGFMNAVATASTSKDLVEAWREIGRFLGYYEETKIRIEQTVKQDVTHRVEGVDLKLLSDEDLMRAAHSDLLERIAPRAPRVLEHQPQEVLEHALDPLGETVALPLESSDRQAAQERSQ